MERQPAKVLRPGDVRKLLRHVRKQRYPERACVIALLSFKAGLRACEISGLQWSMVLASDQRVASQIVIAKSCQSASKRDPRSARKRDPHCGVAIH